MYLGYLTGCLGAMPLKEKAEIARDYGFKALEISCWPRDNGRDYSGSDIDVANLTQEEANKIKAYFEEYGLKITSLAYYDNNLDKNTERRVFINNHFKKCVAAAVMLGVETVGTFVGRNVDKNIDDNFEDFEEVFTDLVGYAEERGIKVVIENCDMNGWHRKGEPGTISFTPELWREMFRRVPNKNFGLNYDPSHLHHLLIDYIAPIDEFKDRIFHIHAKDTEIFEDKLKKYGKWDKQLNTTDDSGYWRYRMPGLGDIDWKSFIEKLKEVGYEGVMSIEHEDPLYEGSEEKVKEGLKLGIEYLGKLI